MNRHTVRGAYSLVLLSIFGLMLTGCYHSKEVIVASPPPPKPSDGKVISGPPPLIPTRDFLLHGAEPFSGFGAFGYVLFTRRPEGDEAYLRYYSACLAFMATLEPIGSYGDYASHRLMPTYWLLSAKPAQETCQELISDYDYARAKPLLSLAGKLSSQGPVLAAWDQLPGNNESPPHQLILDLSNFSDDDMQRAFGIWTERLARDPSLWQNGFDIVRIREEFRNLVQKYGEQIINVITKSS